MISENLASEWDVLHLSCSTPTAQCVVKKKNVWRTLMSRRSVVSVCDPVEQRVRMMSLGQVRSRSLTVCRHLSTSNSSRVVFRSHAEDVEPVNKTVFEMIWERRHRWANRPAFVSRDLTKMELLCLFDMAPSCKNIFTNELDPVRLFLTCVGTTINHLVFL